MRTYSKTQAQEFAKNKSRKTLHNIIDASVNELKHQSYIVGLEESRAVVGTSEDGGYLFTSYALENFTETTRQRLMWEYEARNTSLAGAGLDAILSKIEHLKDLEKNQ